MLLRPLPHWDARSPSTSSRRREIASLCAEPSEDSSSGFVMAAFEVPTVELPALVRLNLVSADYTFAHI